MRRKHILIFAALLFFNFSAGQRFVQAQTFSQPKRLMFAGDEKESEETQNAVLLREHFYPIGWSKDGKFAYLVEPVDEACGCYFANLVVQDMRTDKIIWSNDYEGRENANESLKSHWRKNQKLFSRKLAQYKIVAGKNFKLLESPLTVGGDSVKIDLSSTVGLAEDAYSSKGSVVLKLISKQKGSKIAYRKSYNGEGSDGIMEINQGGVLRSPFESRTAIVLIETKRGWEGPPHITQIRIVGADLTGGFKPSN